MWTNWMARGGSLPLIRDEGQICPLSFLPGTAKIPEARYPTGQMRSVFNQYGDNKIAIAFVGDRGQFHRLKFFPSDDSFWATVPECTGETVSERQLGIHRINPVTLGKLSFHRKCE